MGIHLIDVVAIAVLLVAWIRGIRRGLLRSLLDVVRIVVGYWAAVRYARPAGAWLSAHVSMTGVVATIVGGIAAYLAVQIVFGLVESLLSRMSRDRHGRQRVSAPSRFWGGLIGLATGVVTVVVLCWLYGAARTSAWGERLPSGETSHAMKLSKDILSRGTYAALRGKMDNPQRARRVAAMVSDPEQTTVRLRAVVQDPQVAALVADSAFGRALRSGDEAKIIDNPKLEALLADEATMTQLANLGLVPMDWRSREFRETLGSQLAGVGQHMNVILEDSATKTTIVDLQREGLWQPDRIPQLVTDGRFLALVDRVMASMETKGDTLEAVPRRDH